MIAIAAVVANGVVDVEITLLLLFLLLLLPPLRSELDGRRFL